jgi:hypothetical protein
MGSLKVGTTLRDTIGQLKLGSSNVTAMYNGSVQVFPSATTTTTSTTTTTTTAAPTTTTTTTTTTAAPTTTTTTTTTTTAAPTTTTTTTAAPTTTTTTTAAPTTTSTTTSTTTVPPSTVDVTLQYDGLAWEIYASIPFSSPSTLDDLNFYGTATGYSSAGCINVTSTQGFSITLLAGNTSTHTELGTNPPLDWESMKVTTLYVEGELITTTPQSIVVNGHTYIITGYGNCFNA